MTEGEITGAMKQFTICRAEAETLEYLGDGVYATFYLGQIWLRTLEGNEIALHEEVVGALDRYRHRMLEREDG